MLKFADSTGSLAWEDQQLILRLQTELLAAVSYTLDITTGPSLAFPVQGANNADIGSIWGDPRDAGARSHEGIDIFGKRGTPALAASDGRIMSVREGGLGGKQVWMKPEGRIISLYYAHLDSQLVTMGQRVKAGDTIGL
ncbi:MAG TPA: M23 family metallopeptidase, partial [Chitinophagaceae bacterium]|nr:M23 family metallopeptidase [Chitinophagaceae bacterium]